MSSKIFIISFLSYSLISAVPVAIPLAFPYADPDEYSKKGTPKPELKTTTESYSDVVSKVDDEFKDDLNEGLSSSASPDVSLVEKNLESYRNLSLNIETILQKKKSELALRDEGSSNEKNSNLTQQKNKLKLLKILDQKLLKANERVEEDIEEKNQNLEKIKENFAQKIDVEFDTLNEINKKLKDNTNKK